ncbi:protein mahjong [Anopheles ziemanni]|uniref:protein mahjong n=1 Tax=Anopheles ziemanni TaxID=345580 RepID=UPI00265DA073|nr:protein mahjong [Anopheles ziemanni]
MAQEAASGNELTRIFAQWEEQHSTPGYDPEPMVTRLAEMFETETEAYKMKDPDPFDERHPSRTDPNCELGRMLKALFRKDSFMTRLVNDYMLDNFFTRQRIQQSSFALNVAASRLILVIMPGLDTAAVFQHDNNTHNQLIRRLYNWAETSEEPLKSYATGLLGAAMEVQDIAVSFREQNVRLMPIMLNRLRVLHHQFKENEPITPTEESNRIEAEPMEEDTAGPELKNQPENSMCEEGQSEVDQPEVEQPEVDHPEMDQPEVAQPAVTEPEVEPRRSAGPRLMIPIHPVSSETSQMLILGYLTPMGEYQEFLPHIFEHNVMQLIFSYIEDIDSKDTCLAFEALKYLASLLCHKKFSIEFITNGGLERLLKIPRPSLASTGVSVAFYYLAYCEDAMERICLMPRDIITEMVAYALWLLACPHDSGRCHATMFFGLSCQFKTILDEFDKQDGLRKLYNVISVLPILSNSDEFEINDDEEASERQVVRHVCVALKKYFENHLYYKYVQVTRQQAPSGVMAVPVFKAAKNTPEVISQQITALQELLPMKAHWAPVDELLKLGGINLLLRVVYITYEWNYNGRGDTVRFALDVLNVCCVLPRVHHTFTERVKFPDGASAAGVNIVLGAAEGEIVADAEVQKSALAVLVHLVCAPIHRPGGSLARYGSAKKRMPNKSSEELIQKVWESVRSNNGIIVLLALMCVKTPITDADCIRGMACRALAGLARSDTVRQIVGKLPLFVHGQLQSLMRDPILQEKRVEHVQFQKYALELMERVSGKADSFNNQLDTSLADIHKANVVAQTRIQFNDQQLYQLIYQHLASRGLTETASQLLKETGLSASLMQQNSLNHQNHQGGSSLSRSTVALHSPFVFRSPNTSIVQRSRIRSRTVDPSFNVSTAQANLQAALAATSIETPSQAVPIANGTEGSQTDMATVNMVNCATEIPPEIEASPAELPPIKLIKKSGPSLAVAGNGLSATPFSSSSLTADSNRSAASSTTSQRSLQKQISATDATNFLLLATSNAKAIPAEPTPPTNNITLHTIITEYLTNQHALCKNPMSTCPPFDLFQPHKCPDPRPHRSSGISNNFAARFYRRQTGYASRRFDRRLVHSTFHSSRVIRPQEIDYCFTTCDFTPCGTKLFIGSQAGEVFIYNVNDPIAETSYSCHESAITSMKCSKNGRLLLTTGAWRFPMSALWDINGNQFTQKLHWEEEDYLEFANLSQDKVLATINEVATIYDINTGQKVMKFEPVNCNQYAKNRATFCPTDELILSDGVLWDATSGKEIHKFDKLNQTISGVFHPNGLEIVSNTEVWDLRTFHLLRTVLPLDQSHVKFSPQNVLYGIRLETNSTEDMENCTYETSFKVLDSYDYSSIATIDVKRNIYDLAINEYGSQIAVVENPGSFNNTVQESTVRIYSVGRKRPIEDEQDDEEEEMNSDENSISETESVGSSASNSDDDADDDEDNDDEEGDGDNNNEDGDDDDDDDDDDDEENEDGGGDDSDDSSWTTASDIEDFLLGFQRR